MNEKKQLCYHNAYARNYQLVIFWSILSIPPPIFESKNVYVKMCNPYQNHLQTYVYVHHLRRKVVCFVNVSSSVGLVGGC